MKLKYDLRSAAQRALYIKGAAPKEQHRTCWCGRSIQEAHSGRKPIGVHRQVDGGNARLSNLYTCGSVWACPVCSARICEVRRDELSQAIGNWLQLEGNGINLITRTFPHGSDDDLVDLVERQAKAEQRFRNFKPVKAVYERLGKVGSITGTEVTWGQANGWHPHRHELVFLRGDLSADRSAARILRKYWFRACLAEGLIKLDGTSRPVRNFLRYGIDVRDGKYAAEYVAKYGRDSRWGASAELTKPHSKVGTRTGIRAASWADDLHFTPFQILEWAAGGDGSALYLYREFVAVFTGKRMLTWSRGLRDVLLPGDELTDEQAADSAPPEEMLVGTIDAGQLSTLYKHGQVGAFLAFVAEYFHMPEQRAIDEWIQRLGASPPKYGGRVASPTAMKYGNSFLIEGVNHV
jgi:hypothetical protein